MAPTFVPDPAEAHLPYPDNRLTQLIFDDADHTLVFALLGHRQERASCGMATFTNYDS